MQSQPIPPQGGTRIVLPDPDWAAPGHTEFEAWRRIGDVGLMPEGAVYLAVPWSRLIEGLLAGTGAQAPGVVIGRVRAALAAAYSGCAVVTVCAHPAARRFMALFNACGVTDLFWAHARREDLSAPKTSAPRILAFPLVPIGAEAPFADAPAAIDRSPATGLARLWHAVASGQEPLLGARDSAALPGNPRLWAQAVWRQSDTNPTAVATQLAADRGASARVAHALQQLRLDYGADTLIHDLHVRLLEIAGQIGGDLAPARPGTMLARTVEDLSPVLASGRGLTVAEARLFLSALATALISGEIGLLRQLDRAGKLARMRAAAEAVLPASDAQRWGLDAARRSAKASATLAAPATLARRGPRIYLAGPRGRHTPLSYAPLQAAAGARLQLVESAEAADLVVTGFNLDLQENFPWAASIARRSRAPRFVVLSEEPLWDTTWSDGFADRERTMTQNGDTLDYSFLNHFNSKIFDFARLPYVLLTDDQVIARFRALIGRFIGLTPEELLAHWRAAPVATAFVAEARTDAIFHGNFDGGRVLRLSGFRTDVARASTGETVQRVGLGWSNGPRRQDLPDWQLDKLARFDRKVRILSALENTHVNHYISEKIFDAFAVGAIPVYYAGPDHRIAELVASAAMVNIWGQDEVAAAASIAGFEASRETALAWLHSARKLHALFSDTQAVIDERRRVVDAALTECEQIAR